MMAESDQFWRRISTPGSYLGFLFRCYSDPKDGTITADITTQEGSLVQKLVIDRTHGWMRQAP